MAMFLWLWIVIIICSLAVLLVYSLYLTMQYLQPCSDKDDREGDEEEKVPMLSSAAAKEVAMFGVRRATLQNTQAQ